MSGRSSTHSSDGSGVPLSLSGFEVCEQLSRAAEYSGNRTFLAVIAGCSLEGFIGQADVAAPVVIDDYPSQVALMGKDEHPTRAQIGGAVSGVIWWLEFVQVFTQCCKVR